MAFRQDGVRNTSVGEATVIALNIGLSTDTVARLAARGDGKLTFGSGSAETDTTLYRSSAAVLKTDGSLVSANPFVIADDAPLTAGTKFIVRMPTNCTVTAVRAYRVGGTGAVVNATQASLDLLASGLSVSSASTIMSSTTIQNASVTAGAALIFRVDSVAGTLTQLRMEIDCVGV